MNKQSRYKVNLKVQKLENLPTSKSESTFFWTGLFFGKYKEKQITSETFSLPSGETVLKMEESLVKLNSRYRENDVVKDRINLILYKVCSILL